MMANDGVASGPRRIARLLLRIQIYLGALFVVAGAVFPFYIAGRYGWERAQIFDRFGTPIADASYILLGLGFGLFAIAMGCIGIYMARRSLRAMNDRQTRSN